MKKITFFLTFLICLSTLAEAKTVTLSWDPSPTTTVVGYKVYYDRDNQNVPLDGSGAYEGLSGYDVENTLTTKVTNLEDWASHSFAVTAYDVNGNESAYSNVVTSDRLALEDIDESYELGNGVYVSNGILESSLMNPEDIVWKKRFITVSSGQQICVSGLFNYTDGTHSDVIREVSPIKLSVIDDFSGELLGKEKYIFVDDSYKYYKECIFIEKVSSNPVLIVEQGAKAGDYQTQIFSILATTPTVPAVNDFFVKQLAQKEEGQLGPFNVVFGFQEPIPAPEKYLIRFAKTLQGVLTGEEGVVYSERELLNVGQNEYSFNIPADFQANGFFSSITAIYSEESMSSTNYTGFLPGNILDTVDDGVPFENVSVSTADIYKVRAFLLARSIPVTGNYSASPEARSDLSPDGRITSYDYSLDIGYYRNYGSLRLMNEW